MTKPIHSPIGASSAERWFNCPGSVELCKDAPERIESKYAREGSNAHHLAEVCLKESLLPLELIDYEYTYTEHDKEHTYIVTKEMAEAVKVYVDVIAKDKLILGSYVVEVEKSFDLDTLHEGLYGTNDCCLISRDKITIYDYKHGKGIPVEVGENKQLLYYALGAMLNYKNVIFEIELVIVQPRAFHKDGPVRRWSLSVKELFLFSEHLQAAAIRTEEKDAPLVTGKHCRFCPAKAICPEQEKLLRNATDHDFQEILPSSKVLDSKTLDLQKLINIKASGDQIREFLSAIDDHLFHMKLSGKDVPGYKLVKKRGVRKWKDEKQVLQTVPT